MCEISDGKCPVWKDEKRKARKDHRCVACGETIRRGDTYEKHVDIFDGYVTDIKRCLRCATMWRAAQSKLGWNRVADLYLNCGEDWEDRYGEPPAHIAALAFWRPGEPLPEGPDEQD